MELQPRAIPGESPAGVVARMVATAPGTRTVSLVVDAASVARGPLHRGQGPPFMMAVREGQHCRVTSQGEQRQGFLPVVGPGPSHLGRFHSLHPGRIARAICGAGNLGLNPGVLARLGRHRYGILGRFNGALRVSAQGMGERCAGIEDPGDGFLLTGPLLVRDGFPFPVDPTVFPDPRHLLLFPYAEVCPGVRVDLGQDQLLGDPGLYARAVAGAAVELHLTQALPVTDLVSSTLEDHPIAPAKAREALAAKGYRESQLPAEPGTYRLRATSIEIVFLPGIYPHHVLAITEGDAVASILVSGRSNRVGVTVGELAEDLARQGVREALLMDNGGDVGLYRPDRGEFLVRPAEPDRHERWPLSACLVYHEPPVR